MWWHFSSVRVEPHFQLFPFLKPLLQHSSHASSFISLQYYLFLQIKPSQTPLPLLCIWSGCLFWSPRLVNSWPSAPARHSLLEGPRLHQTRGASPVECRWHGARSQHPGPLLLPNGGDDKVINGVQTKQHSEDLQPVPVEPGWVEMAAQRSTSTHFLLKSDYTFISFLFSRWISWLK